MESFDRQIVLCCVVLLYKVTCISGACTFPASLRGLWIRSYDNTALTFTGNTVSGSGLQYIADTLGPLTCHQASGDRFILSVDYQLTSGTPFRYLTCWKFVEVTASSFILYELTNVLADFTIFPPGSAAVTQAQSSAVTASSVCTRSETDTLFTTLIMNGALPTDVAAQCPSALFANFRYPTCADTSLAFCPGRTTATANYSLCPTNILGSAGGVLSCTGHATQGGFTYVNLYKHDVGNGITCLRYTADANGRVTANYVLGDCTSSFTGAAALNLEPILTCPLPSDGDSASAALIGGTTVGVVALVALIGAGGFVLFKKKQNAGRKVHDAEKPVPPAVTVDMKQNVTFPDISEKPRNNELPPLPQRDLQLPPLPEKETMGEESVIGRG